MDKLHSCTFAEVVIDTPEAPIMAAILLPFGTYIRLIEA